MKRLLVNTKADSASQSHQVGPRTADSHGISSSEASQTDVGPRGGVDVASSCSEH